LKKEEKAEAKKDSVTPLILFVKNADTIPKTQGKAF
jgi:hypothetical protein